MSAGWRAVSKTLEDACLGGTLLWPRLRGTDADYRPNRFCRMFGPDVCLLLASLTVPDYRLTSAAMAAQPRTRTAGTAGIATGRHLHARDALAAGQESRRKTGFGMHGMQTCSDVSLRCCGATGTARHRDGSLLQVFMLSAEDHLDEEMLESIVNAEHTRVPVYEGERCALVCLHQATTLQQRLDLDNECLSHEHSARPCNFRMPHA